MAKATHTCERCGHRWHERTAGIFDELCEWIQHADALEREYRRELARLALKLQHAKEHIEYLETLAKNHEVLARYWERRSQAETVPF